MRWLCNLLVALSIPAIGVAGTSFQVAIDGEPLAKADVYLYANPDQRTWIAAVADGVADLPDDLTPLGSWHFPPQPEGLSGSCRQIPVILLRGKENTR